MMTDPIRISPPHGRAPVRVLRGLSRPPWGPTPAHGADREPAPTVGALGQRGARTGLRISLTMPGPTSPALDDPSRHAP